MDLGRLLRRVRLRSSVVIAILQTTYSPRTQAPISLMLINLVDNVASTTCLVDREVLFSDSCPIVVSLLVDANLPYVVDHDAVDNAPFHNNLDIGEKRLMRRL